MHETVVAVDPQFRSAGVGSALQQAIAEQRPGGAELVVVFREEPESPAYRWYLKNGFSPVMRIDSWMCDDTAHIVQKAADFRVWQTADRSIPWGELHLAWRSSPPTSCGGGVDRASRDLPAWLAKHPYRLRYAFHIIADAMAGYALLGVGTMHSETVRADVLAMMPNSGDPTAFESLLNAVGAVASEKNWRPVRLPLARTDAHVPLLKSRGFTSRWTFDMLTRPLTRVQITQEMIATWRYSGIDYA